MSNPQSRTYSIGGMDCAGCAREVETAVARLDTVQQVQVDFMTGKMHVIGNVDFPTLKARVEAVGKLIESPQQTLEDTPAPSTPPGGLPGFWNYLLSRAETQLAVMGGAMVLITFGIALLDLLPETVINLAYMLGLALSLYPIARSGLRTLWINRQFNINLLMAIAALGALWMGEFLEGATVIFLFAIGEALEGYTADRARQSIRSLMTLKPMQAVRLRHDGSEEKVPVAALQVGDVLSVKPGEAVPMDGIISSGHSTLNQAPITGESLPVAKGEGDEVYAGTLNGEGFIQVRVTRLAADNTLSRIIQLVEEAQSVRAPSQRLIDRFANGYTPLVVLLAAAIALIPPLLFNQPFYDTATEHGWLYRALSMLVIACPCALVISTPVTIISSITAAARRGVLIKGGVHLETLGTIKAIAFDKTGTLTQGKPVAAHWRSVDCVSGEPCTRCDDVLSLAAALEQRTSHPLAQAVLNAAQERALLRTYSAADSAEVLPGLGIRGQVDGHLVTIGSHALFDQAFPHSTMICDLIQQQEAQGYSTMLVADGDSMRGYIAVTDALRATSKSVVQTLNTLALPTIMLTGDHPAAAQQVAQAIGVVDFRASLLPQHKVQAIQQLSQHYGSVAMVGDGINDTPALAAASVSIAMGGAGSPQALETADVALMADDLTQLPFVIRLARFARRLILENVVLSFGLKAVFLVLAFFGLTSLWVAILADVGMALLVTLNGMRPLRFNEGP